MRLALTLSIICLSVASFTTTAQARLPDGAAAADRAEVLKVLNAFFVAMRARDGDAIRKLVLPKTEFAWLGRPANGGSPIIQESIEEFIPQAQAAQEPWLERVWSPTVHVNNGVAVVWAPYDFYRGAAFSHNGTDCYVFLKTPGGWKIAGLSFTVEPSSKTLNPLGPPK
jgi:hypothetical protein